MVRKNHALVLHIGLPKTATTFIQEKLLAGSPGYLGKNSKGASLLGSNRLVTEFKKLATYHRFMEAERVRKQTNEWVRQLSKLPINEKTNGFRLSGEELSWWPSSTSPLDVFAVGSQSTCREKRYRPLPAAEFLKRFLTPALLPLGTIKVVIVLRNQADYLAALYAQRARHRRKAGQRDFEDQIELLQKEGDPTVDWLGMVEDLEWAVGSENVEVLFYEDASLPGFWPDFCYAMGLDRSFCSDCIVAGEDRANVKKTEYGVWKMEPYMSKPERLFRKCLPVRWQRLKAFRALNETSWGQRDSRFVMLPAEVRLQIQEAFRESNERLAVKVGRDLKSVGY